MWVDPSPVWKCAEKVEGGAKCNLCGKLYKSTLGNTKGIIGHLLTKHSSSSEVKVLSSNMAEKKRRQGLKRVEKLKKEKNQPPIASFSNKRSLMERRKQEKMDKSLVMMNEMMNRPFSDVGNHHFRQMLYIAEPNCICPSARKHTATRGNSL